MRKKIIFMAVCAVLLLIFVSSSYGEWDPKYVLLAHPWEEPCVSPPKDNTEITYDKAAKENNTISILAIRIIGNTIVITKKANYISSPESIVHKPSSSKNNER